MSLPGRGHLLLGHPRLFRQRRGDLLQAALRLFLTPGQLLEQAPRGIAKAAGGIGHSLGVNRANLRHVRGQLLGAILDGLPHLVQRAELRAEGFTDIARKAADLFPRCRADRPEAVGRLVLGRANLVLEAAERLQELLGRPFQARRIGLLLLMGFPLKALQVCSERRNDLLEVLGPGLLQFGDLLLDPRRGLAHRRHHARKLLHL